MIERDRLRRIVLAMAAAATTGSALLLLMRQVLLPELQGRLTGARLVWLREAFVLHPRWFLLAILAVSAILSLPVLLVALWIALRQPKRTTSS